MATNDDLDDFFKKKDRKGKKHHKPTGSLINNEELLKQLVIVTSATSAFKDNMDFDDVDDEDPSTASTFNHTTTTTTPGTYLPSNNVNDPNEFTSAVVYKSKSNSKLPVQENHPKLDSQPVSVGQQQDEWEDYDDPKADYEHLRLKLTRGNANHDDEDRDDDDSDDHHHEHGTSHEGLDGDEEQSNRSQRRREQTTEKKVWKLDQVNASESTATAMETPIEKIEEPPVDSAAPKLVPSTGSSNVYRPPHSRGNASVTVVSGNNQRKTKKEKLNIASTEEFPTLGVAVNKK